MSNMISVAKWLGRRGPVLEPEQIHFTAKAKKGCSGCIFNGQPSDICRKANDLARLADLADCDMGVIYILRETNPRQLSIEVK